jgi:uncharacterized protein (UPF0335 family)
MLEKLSYSSVPQNKNHEYIQIFMEIQKINQKIEDIFRERIKELNDKISRIEDEREEIRKNRDDLFGIALVQKDMLGGKMPKITKIQLRND